MYWYGYIIREDINQTMHFNVTSCCQSNTKPSPKLQSRGCIHHENIIWVVYTCFTKRYLEPCEVYIEHHGIHKPVVMTTLNHWITMWIHNSQSLKTATIVKGCIHMVTLPGAHRPFSTAVTVDMSSMLDCCFFWGGCSSTNFSWGHTTWCPEDNSCWFKNMLTTLITKTFGRYIYS